MLKRILALFLVVLSLSTTALADVYIANPNPEDRLHLRESASSNAKSLGKYYNGAPIEVIGGEKNGWFKVKVGYGAAQTGYMKASYLSTSKQTDAMPQYITPEKTTAYRQPSTQSATVAIASGRLISLMGVIEDDEVWYHILVHTQSSEGSYDCFVPKRTFSLKRLTKENGVQAYISNPDKADRLHLRTQPSKNAKSLGKFYNGTIGTVLGFVDDGHWVKVEMYRQIGYMDKRYLCLEGEGPNTAYYGIPTVSAGPNGTKVYWDLPDETDNYEAILNPGELLEVLGLVGDDVLLVRRCKPNRSTWYAYRKDTDFVDTRY